MSRQPPTPDRTPLGEAVRSEIELLMSSTQALAVLLDKEMFAKAQIRGYVDFLLTSKDQRVYSYLANFLEWYGVEYVLPEVLDLLKQFGPFPPTAVELGAGSGWLIGGLGEQYRQPALFKDRYAIDKRPELYKPQVGVKFMKVDLEDTRMPLFIPSDCLIIANHFLHCVDNWEEVIGFYAKSTWLVIEPRKYAEEFPYWYTQMELFGAKPIDEIELLEGFNENGLGLVVEAGIPGQAITLWRPK